MLAKVGVPRHAPLTLTAGGSGQEKSIMTLLLVLSFLGWVSSGLIWQHGVKGVVIGPNMAPWSISMVIYRQCPEGELWLRNGFLQKGKRLDLHTQHTSHK